jgi:hypothetical protein
MRRRGFASRIVTTVSAIAAVAAIVSGPGAFAQKAPADLTVLPPTPTTYTPGKTPWGDWDFRGTWPIENIASTRILFQRQKTYGNRIWVTKEEHDKRVANAERSDKGFTTDSLNAGGTQGLADWVKSSDFSWRTSMLVSPADGQLPPLTAKGEALYKAGRSGWVPRQEFDWVDDFDSWDRCISRGFPASMFPFRYNYGQRIWQSPGYVVIELEMLGTRVIPIGPNAKKVPAGPEAWMGYSRAHWEGKTLIIETDHIKSGDSATHNPLKRAASPLNMATQNVPPFNTLPTSDKAHTVEKLTMTGPNSILYEITYDDPETFTKPWTAQLEWSRDDKYEMPEYACHEGDVQVRNYITASRAHRRDVAAGISKPIDTDTRDRFAQQFDFDPVAPPDPNAPRPAPRGGAPAGAPAGGQSAPAGGRPPQ